MPQYSQADREERTERAVEMRSKCKSISYIAREIGVTDDTAKKWIENEYARRSEHRGASQAREKAISVYEAIIAEGWERMERIKDTSLNVAGVLNAIRAAQERIDKLTGSEAPVKYQNVDEDFEIVFDDDDSLAQAS